MVFILNSFALFGTEIRPIKIEMDLSNQLPSFSMVGLASQLTQESRERVRSAVVNSGYDWPGKKITANLTPVDLPKWGSHFELPMCVGIIELMKEKPITLPILSFGDISLGGEITASGLGYAVANRFNQYWGNLKPLIVGHPADVLYFQNLVPQENLIALTTIKDWNEMRQKFKKMTLPEIPKTEMQITKDSEKADFSLLSEVKGEPLAQLASLVTLTNPELHLMLVGSQGTGKSMTAKAIAQASGVLSERDRADRFLIDRLCGSGLNQRPVRYLQTTMSRAALEGALKDNGQVNLGELSKAHGGFVVMDEFLEYRRDVLEALRQPLEQGVVRLQRAKYSADIPARFQLIATTNLCACGNWLGTKKKCRCTINRLLHYQRKLSGPLLDRFDMIVLLGGEKKFFESDEMILTELSNWLQQLDWSTAVAQAKSIFDSVELLSEKNSDQNQGQQSRRGVKKSMVVARTICALMGETKVNSTHQALSRLIRFDVEQYLSIAM